LNTLDIIILVPLLFGAYHGFKKGFLMEIVSLLAFVLAIIGGFKLLHTGMELLDQHFDINGNLLPYVAFIVIFILIVIGLNMLGKMIKKALDMTLLGSVDNIAGLILGTLKWAFGISILLWLTSYVGLLLPEEYINQSMFFGYVEPIAPVTVDYISTIFPFANDLFEMIEGLIVPSP
jgi:membrane protein required for colicin V production